MKDISFLTKSYIAHRGLHDKIYPENSLGAFKNAIKKGYSIECDIHVTKDKKVVVFHDNNLKRMTGCNKFIKDCTYEELKQLSLNHSNYKIPLLSEVLKLVSGKVPLIIELKFDSKVGILEKEATKLLDSYQGDFAVKSFSFFSILWFLLYRKNYVRGQLLKNNKYFFMNLFTRPDFLSYNIHNLNNNKKVQTFRKRRIVLGYTVRTKEELEKIKDKCDNYICEDFI